MSATFRWYQPEQMMLMPRDMWEWSPGQDRNPKGEKPYKRGYGEPEEKARSNFTDPESQIMKTGTEGFQQGYNAQVDGEPQLGVATKLTANGSDQRELPALLDEVEAT